METNLVKKKFNIGTHTHTHSNNNNNNKSVLWIANLDFISFIYHAIMVIIIIIIVIIMFDDIMIDKMIDHFSRILKTNFSVVVVVVISNFQFDTHTHREV